MADVRVTSNDTKTYIESEELEFRASFYHDELALYLDYDFSLDSALEFALDEEDIYEYITFLLLAAKELRRFKLRLENDR